MPKVKITKNGPYIVSGNLPLKREIIDVDELRNSVAWKDGEEFPKQEEYSLCRCGKSKGKPFCDGSHVKAKFDGTETASREKFLKISEKIEGPDLILRDAPELCANARFCHNRDGSVWNLTRNSGNKRAKEIAIQQACNCSAGRLVVYDKNTEKAIEPDHKPQISLVEDPEKSVSGPIWVKGDVSIESADGKEYEKRNRVTLCRCGNSLNKPFCDGTHIFVGFKDDKEEN